MTRSDDILRGLPPHAAPPPLEAKEDDIDILGLFRIIRRRFWLMLATGFLVVAITLPAIMSISPTYFASSRMLIQSPLAARLSEADANGLNELNLATEMERLLARDVAVRTITGLGLDHMAEFNPDLRTESALSRFKTGLRDSGRTLAERAVALVGTPKAPEPELDLETEQADDPMRQILPYFFEALRVGRDPATNVVSIGFYSNEPALAAAVPNTLLQVYLQTRAEERAREASGADRWLSERIDRQVQRLREQERALEKFLRESGQPSSERAAANLQALAALDLEHSRIARERAELTSMVEVFRNAGSPQEKLALIDTREAHELSRELQVQLRGLDTLLLTLGENSAEVMAARAEIKQTQALVDIEVERAARALKTEIAALDREAEAAQVGMQAAREAVSGQDIALSQRQVREQAVATEKARLARLEEQRRDLSAERELPVAAVEMLSPATIPLMQSSRGRMTYLIGAIVAGGALAFTIACLVEFMDRSVRSFQQLRTIPDISSAGMVPRLPRRGTRSLAALRRRPPEGQFRDAVRGILLSLKRSNRGTLPSSILVTSAYPGEGKSVLAVALASELADTGADVLLIDGDLRRGRLHGMLQVPPGPGLTELEPGARNLANLIRRDPESGIEFITRGERAGAAFGDLDDLSEILRRAKEAGKIVVIDGLPALAAVEAAIIAEKAERTLFAVRWGRTGRSAVEAAMERLRDVRKPAQLLVVINAFNPRRHALYGYQDAPAYTSALRRYRGSI